jgi:SAM-dependent methyltransferase
VQLLICPRECFVSDSHSLSAVTYHDGLAPDWDLRYAHGSFKRRAEFISRSVFSKVDFNGLWLDAGCGSGYFSRMLADRGARVIGLDGSLQMIDQAKKLIERDGLQDAVKVERVVTIESIPYPDKSFEGCVCFSVIEYLKNPFALLDEISRVLRPGGTLIISIPHALSPVRLAQRLLRSVRANGTSSKFNYLESSSYAVKPGKIEHDLKVRGLQIVHSSGFDALLPHFSQVFLPPSLVFILAKKVE